MAEVSWSTGLSLHPQVLCLMPSLPLLDGSEVEWCARVIDSAGNITYIEAGFSTREHAANVARTVARGLSISDAWVDV